MARGRPQTAKMNAQLTALSSQMAQVASAPSLLNQHSQALQDLADTTRHMNTQMSNITTQLSQVAASLVQLSTAQTPPVIPSPPPPDRRPTAPSSPPSREPYIPTPERYSGDQGTCQEFLMQMSLVFAMQPLTYSTDEQKISYTLSLLTGAARRWGSAVWMNNNPVCDSYSAFTAAMREVFDHPVQGQNAAKRLGSLKQGGRSVADYAVEFRTLVAELVTTSAGVCGGRSRSRRCYAVGHGKITSQS
uniref:DUF4939 domain-containing protein n=1 Tax=Acanthochromis polyacanthus TaxID=80966 RepID=A0A3Q1G1E1_9TELE